MTTTAQPGLDSMEAAGFAVLADLLTEDARRELIGLFPQRPGEAGRRDALGMEPVRAVVRSRAVRTIVQALLGPGAFATKATLFDKTAETNWLVPWHQDVMVPVRERLETPGYGAWSMKGGTPYVRPPATVLESMVALRLDLDGSTEHNGPLRVLPGTHRRGLLDADELGRLERRQPAVTCLVPAGGGVLMRPLLVHASSKATRPAHRRIVHIEFAGADLRGPVEWLERCCLDDSTASSKDPDRG